VFFTAGSSGRFGGMNDARIDVTRHDGAAFHGIIPLVEAETGLPAGAIGPVA
jgi:hypothetical protein